MTGSPAAEAASAHFRDGQLALVAAAVAGLHENALAYVAQAPVIVLAACQNRIRKNRQAERSLTLMLPPDLIRQFERRVPLHEVMATFRRSRIRCTLSRPGSCAPTTGPSSTS